MFSSFFSRFSACFSSFVKLLSIIEAVCRVEATLLLTGCYYDRERTQHWIR